MSTYEMSSQRYHMTSLINICQVDIQLYVSEDDTKAKTLFKIRYYSYDKC